MIENHGDGGWDRANVCYVSHGSHGDDAPDTRRSCVRVGVVISASIQTCPVKGFDADGHGR